MTSLMFFSWSRAEDGAIAPIGPIGPAGQNVIDGTTGQDRTDGSDGQDGTDGNANVMVSAWFSFDKSYWTVNSTETYAFIDKDAPEIAQKVIDNAAILVYSERGPGSGDLVWQLPHYNGIWFNDYQIPNLVKIRLTLI